MHASQLVPVLLKMQKCKNKQLNKLFEITCSVTSQANSGVRQISKNSCRLRISWNSEHITKSS